MVPGNEQGLYHVSLCKMQRVTQDRLNTLCINYFRITNGGMVVMVLVTKLYITKEEYATFANEYASRYAIVQYMAERTCEKKVCINKDPFRVHFL